MPQKTIYIKDENLALYEKAEKIAGTNISNVIADLLRDYIKNAEDSFEVHAVCFVEETTDHIPYFYPKFFVRGGSSFEIKCAYANRYDFPIYVMPLFYATEEIKEAFYNAESKDIIDFDDI